MLHDTIYICQNNNDNNNNRQGRTRALRGATELGPLREMGGAPRNLAPKNHFLVRLVKASG